MSKDKTFQVGDRVTWSSQAQGSVTAKTGQVVEVVPAGRYPGVRDRHGAHVFVNTRRAVSYIIAVPQPVTKRGAKDRPAKLYWPNATGLRRAPGRKPHAPAPLIGVSPPTSV